MLVEHLHAASDPETKDLVRRSDAALQAGHPWDAEALARMALTRDDAYIPARLALGRALEARGRHSEAAAVYAEAARISPHSPGVSKSLRRVWVAPLAGFGVLSGLIWVVFRQLGRRFDQHTVLLALLISAAALIVGTLVLLRNRRRRFASLSPEDRALVEAHGAVGGLLAMPAPGRLLTVGAVIVALSAAGVAFAVGTKPSLLMQVGDCFSLDTLKSIQQVSAIPCDLPHDTEIFAVVDDPSLPGATYPGIDAVAAAANPACELAYQAFVGEPYGRSAHYSIMILSPEYPYWVNGVRTNWCTVREPSGHQTTGSAKDKGR